MEDFLKAPVRQLDSKTNKHISIGQIDLKTSNHLFRYASEWDPREPGHTKGGYLEGNIQLPPHNNLRLVLSTCPDSSLVLDKELLDRFPEAACVHPLILCVVRKGKGNKRLTEREPVPNHFHWRQEFHVVNRCVHVVNRKSGADLKRESMDPLPEIDRMFMLGKDGILPIGKGAGQLNLIFLIPKTEARALDDEVTLTKVIADRVKDPEATAAILAKYQGKMSTNIKRVRIKVDIFCQNTGDLLHSSISSAICDTASKEHGVMDIMLAHPLQSCANGGRKVFMLAENQLAKDVEPRFLLYSSCGKTRLRDKEHLLKQPNNEKPEHGVLICKDTIIFITPPQPNMEGIMREGWLIKLVAVRVSDGLECATQFPFRYVPADYYSPCIFCTMDPDKTGSGAAKLPSPIGPARPGVKKRRMPENRPISNSPSPSGGTYVKRTVPGGVLAGGTELTKAENTLRMYRRTKMTPGDGGKGRRGGLGAVIASPPLHSSPQTDLPVVLPSIPALPSVPTLPSVTTLPFMTALPFMPALPSIPDMPNLPAMPDMPALIDLRQDGVIRSSTTLEQLLTSSIAKAEVNVVQNIKEEPKETNSDNQEPPLTPLFRPPQTSSNVSLTDTTNMATVKVEEVMDPVQKPRIRTFPVNLQRIPEPRHPGLGMSSSLFKFSTAPNLPMLKRTQPSPTEKSSPDSSAPLISPSKTTSFSLPFINSLSEQNHRRSIQQKIATALNKEASYVQKIENLNNLDNLDIIDNCFEPLPPTINEKLEKRSLTFMDIGVQKKVRLSNGIAENIVRHSFSST